MSVIHKSVKIIGLLALSLGLTTAAQAGYYYEATTISTSDDKRGSDTTQVRAWVEGTSTRIEFEEGNTMGFFEPESYIISRDAGDTMILVDTKEKTYTKLELGSTMSAASKALEGLGGMFKVEFTDFHVGPIDESAGGEILGYDTRHLSYDSGYTMSMSMMGRDMSQVVRMDSEIWVTDGIDASAFSAWMRPDKMLKGMFEGLDELMAQQMSQFTGTPLKMVIDTVSTDTKGRETSSNMVTEVTTLREEQVAAALFEVPEGFTEQTLMTDANQGEADSKEDSPMKTLKGLFGRRD